MIGCKQVGFKTPIGSSESPIMAVFQQLWQPIFIGTWLPPWVTFHAGNLTKCYGYARTGTFTAKIYIDGVHVFTVSNTDTTTPTLLIGAETGALQTPDIITCEVTACSSTVEGVHIQII